MGRYYSGSIDITYNQKERYFSWVGEKKKKFKACYVGSFISRDDGWGHQ
uniref:Uncharacterized protein n=1 Tax=Acinetobacter phage vB_AbaM-SPB TaxID=3236747 RepID=A0AB39C8X7_9CAUD